MFCQKCGRPNDDDAVQCAHCAAPLYQAVPAVRTSGKAAWSLALGILGLFCAGVLIGPIAIILGFFAKGDINRSDGRLRGDGLALAGIIIGACSIILWLFWGLMIFAIAVPNFIEAKHRSMVSRTRVDMQSIATAIESYRVDNQVYPKSLPALTTPISYLSTLPNDNFSKSNGEEKQSYDYSAQHGHWVLRSPGPDEKADANLEEYAGWTEMPSQRFINWLYDPTNGAVSPGDVIRTGP